MTIDNKQYLYSSKNDTGSQDPTTRNLEIHSNEQTELRKISQTHKFELNKSKIAQKKLGTLDSQLYTCYY